MHSPASTATRWPRLAVPQRWRLCLAAEAVLAALTTWRMYHPARLDIPLQPPRQQDF
jgi:hypothetical protein